MEIKRIVCLANSRKPDGRCIAGKEPTTGEWTRPVSLRPGGSVSEEERAFEDGSDAKLLDVVDIPLIRPMPGVTQPENWLLDPDWYWERVDVFDLEHIEALADDPPELWENGNSTVAGENDRVPQAQTRSNQGSLYFVRVRDLTVRVLAPGAAFGNPKRKVRGRFQYRGADYDMTITDPVVERRYLAGPDGQFRIGSRLLTVSLAEPHEGYAYKLIAAVLPER